MANGRRISPLGHRDHYIRLYRTLLSQLGAQPLAKEVDVLSVYDTVRSGKVYQLKDTIGRLRRSKGLRPQAVLVYVDYLAGRNLSKIFRPNLVKGATLRGHGVAVLQLTDA